LRKHFLGKKDYFAVNKIKEVICSRPNQLVIDLLIGSLYLKDFSVSFPDISSKGMIYQITK